MTPKPAPLIRPAEPGDATLIVDYNLRLADESEGVKLDRARVERGVRRLIEAPRHGVYYIAEVEGRAVGQLMLTREWSDWRDGEFWWIQSVYVDAAFRRRGVFAALYAHVAAQAAANPDVCGLRLYVEVDNAAAQATYRRHGMHLTSYRVMEATDLADHERP